MAPAEVRLCACTDSTVQAGTRVVTVEVRTLGGGNTGKPPPRASPAIGYCIHSLSTSLAQQIIQRDTRALPHSKVIDSPTWR
jgi:hypothetical protein